MRSLASHLRPHAPLDGANPTCVEGLYVYRRSERAGPTSAVYAPSLILVAQGRKRARVDDEVYVYDPDHYLVTSVPIPLQSEILEASPERPFLSLALDVDLAAVRELMARVPALQTAEPPERGLAACPVTPPIRDVCRRLVELLDRPDAAPALGPLYQRELLYHVLEGPRGGALRAVAMGSGQQSAIADVLARIHADCAQSFSVPELAGEAGMSETVFYEAFKVVTGATPMQYVKRLRLQEAHRLLSTGLHNVSGAAFGVGYNSLSQFSREFTRVFGASPSSYIPR